MAAYLRGLCSDEPAKLVPPHENDAITDVLDVPCQVISAALVGDGRIVDICTPGYTAANHTWTGDAIIGVARGAPSDGFTRRPRTVVIFYVCKNATTSGV